jgi:cytoskeletal protein CcmA (bactofilin family)
MWKRDEAVKPPQPVTPSPAVVPEPSAPRFEANRRHQERDVVNIGKSVIIKGELSGSEDLTIEGQVEGKIELRQNVLTIGPNGKIKAQVTAKTVVVEGQVQGNIAATERVDIRDNGTVDGDLVAPRVAIADGAHFRGAIDMQKQPRSEAKPGDVKPGDVKPGDAKPGGDAKPDVKPAEAKPAAPSQAPAAASMGR